MADQPGCAWPAPAKLNLMLHITGRRANGYHELQTVFQFIDLCDQLRFRVRDDGRIMRTAGDERIPEADDLVTRSARLLQSHTGTPLGVEISLEKAIPMGAGLGGGSSDAATALHALNLLWELGIDDESLASIGLELGADVPVFVRGFAAFAEGVGERLQPVFPKTPWYLLITPDVHVSTGEIFAAGELTRDCPAIKISGLSDEEELCRRIPEWDNVLQPVVTARYPSVAEAVQRLDSVLPAGEGARMTGTGSTVFADFNSRADAEKALKTLQAQGMPENWRISINRGHNTSPLFAFLQERFGRTL